MQQYLQKYKINNFMMMNWDDLKLFLAVARTEKLNVAAKQLKLDSSTVSRRLHKLEQQLATKLFERGQDGHQLTSSGQVLLANARQMEQMAQLSIEQMQHLNQPNSGLVRVGVTEGFGSYFIAPNLLPFKQKHPNIQLDLLQFDRSVKINRNEADIAISIEPPKATSVIVQPLCHYQLRLYARKSFFEQIPRSVAQLPNYDWISYIDDLLFTDELNYLNEIHADICARYRTTSIVSQYQMIKSGLGIGILPCFIAQQDPELISVLTDDIAIERQFYMLTHPESMRLTHVANTWQFLKQLCEQHKDQLCPVNLSNLSSA